VNYRFKVWLEQDGQPVFGDGLLNLLRFVRQYGSIRRSAEEMKMSYRQAWGSIRKAESRLGVSLLIKQVGGEAGGGAYLTPEAESLIRKYEGFKLEAEEAVKKSFFEYFKQ